MMFADTSRGPPFSKDLAVVEFAGHLGEGDSSSSLEQLKQE
jgi:hypothetical protein